MAYEYMSNTIRKAEDRDVSSLAVVSIEVWLNTYLRDGVSQLFADYVLSEFTAKKFQDAINDPYIAIWVSENEIGINGFVAVHLQAAPLLADCSPLEIMTLYVRPRSQATGRGVALLHRALEHCSEVRGKSAWLKVNVKNSRAIDFYSRHGFNKIGSTHFRVADQAYENYVMRIHLPRPAG